MNCQYPGSRYVSQKTNAKVFKCIHLMGNILLISLSRNAFHLAISPVPYTHPYFHILAAAPCVFGSNVLMLSNLAP